MTKLLIVDDEPLVCVGVQSMLRWEDYGIEVVGTARNGEQAAEMIEELRPEIVISDIKMPLKTGLELAKDCGERYGRVPLFIMLTSYEEFELVRKAIAYQVVDYLIKLELDEAALSAAIGKAMGILAQVSQQAPLAAGRSNLQSLREKFFIRLLGNLFEEEEQYRAQLQDLDLELEDGPFTVGFFEIVGPVGAPPNGEKLAALCSSTLQMAKETLAKYLPCYVTGMDMRHFAVVFRLEGLDTAAWQAAVRDAVGRTATLLHNYFNIQLRGAVGHSVQQARHLAAAYQTAKQAYVPAGAEALRFYTRPEGETAAGASPALLELQKQNRKALEELDFVALEDSLTRLAALLAASPGAVNEAKDAACEVLYMAISLLPEGSGLLWQIFSDDPEGYRCIYRLNTVESIVEWLCRLRDGCCAKLKESCQSYKQQLVGQVQSYINQNLGRKLTLNEVAAVFNFSPNYLSQLFARHAELGFVEYITAARVSAAKEMLARGEGKIYEIAEKLGFESSFYFSKVFKRAEGMSPREYQQAHQPAVEG